MRDEITIANYSVNYFIKIKLIILLNVRLVLSKALLVTKADFYTDLEYK